MHSLWITILWTLWITLDNPSSRRKNLSTILSTGWGKPQFDFFA
ncbi:hypothetical protein CORMATOL_00882 [Corynebacterium matruchotii ATCC 33806]|uniref:Uncharacterized protein n=1 Tax=Corynebacterium matruchotii ATCC 33806 TaxID=566549 RepID=C0E1N1_9CORY|nr:hypothetical protein CORMATOL_00882 [Corynebacterium matruchotii ATCC 33806]